MGLILTPQTESSAKEAEWPREVQVRGERQTEMTDFFKHQTVVERARSNRKEFRRQGRRLRRRRRENGTAKRGEVHKDDVTMGFTTVNVRGLATRMKHLSEWLQGVKEKHERGNRDIIFLQETHLNKNEHSDAAEQYAAMWGFKASVAHKLSWWSSGEGRRAGTAILLNPYGAVSLAQPWGIEHWSEHLIMVTGVIGGKVFLFINIYAPSHGAVRTLFFRKLRGIAFPEDVEILLGGDFNCVENRRLDRVGGSKSSDGGAKILTAWVDKMELIDTGFYNMPVRGGQGARNAYARDHHTHRHTAASGDVGTSRLDRWYISASSKKMVRSVQAEEPPCRTDHRAVLLELHHPQGPIRVKKRGKVYPAPAYVQTATTSLIEARLVELRNTFAHTERENTRAVWENFKLMIKKEMAALRRMARQRMTQGFRQQIKRLKQSLQQCGYETQGAEAERVNIMDKIHKLQDQRRVLRRRVLVNRNTWNSKSSTRHFFRRISTKYGDNTIPRLQSRARGGARKEHDQANVLAESWETIFNGVPSDKDNATEYIERMAKHWKAEDLSDVDEEITEIEVQAAIMKCKIGKACGPDELSNEWYRDNIENLVPILTRMFNDCLEDGIAPSSFLEAYIFSISKGGDKSNPLNYRPIALLNTDYKVFTRIMAWRVRRHIARLVKETQYGFIPGRTIHEAIDLFEAAKEACSKGEQLEEAQVLLLDFAKAYDSLDRDFLLKVLEAKGFPPKFCRIVRAIHTNTTVRFMANGSLSRAVQVSSGIRQGCPLAPLLFILAVDLLYDEIQNEQQIRGVPLRGSQDETTGRQRDAELRVAGYADDTAIYVESKHMQAAAIAAVGRFSSVSGLMLNVKKSAAISLCGQEDMEMDENEIAPQDNLMMEETGSTRYLGHVAGVSDTTVEAWTKAMKALRVRLVLAETKTNTVQQRAAIAGAVIIPKLLYVARHAWPSEDMVKTMDLCIRNFVWSSHFTEPEVTPKGWITASIAEQPPAQGGLGIPNLRRELIAMSASRVGEWALAEPGLKQIAGDILKERDGGDRGNLVPTSRQPSSKMRETLWRTGSPWTGFLFAEPGVDGGYDEVAAQEMRKALKRSSQVRLRWSAEGLTFQCEGAIADKMRHTKTVRQEVRGDFCQGALRSVPLRTLMLWDARGERCNWGAYKKLITKVADKCVGELLQVDYSFRGTVIFRPTGRALPLDSGVASLFLEMSYNIVANFPEVMFKGGGEELVRVHHPLQDKHHIFELDQQDDGTITHSWGPTATTFQCEPGRTSVQGAVAKILNVQPEQVWLSPHPRLSRITALWAGCRRWRQSRRRYKALIMKEGEAKVKAATSKIRNQWRKEHTGIAAALECLEWKTVHGLQGVSAYQSQNLVKLKAHRLRLWAGAELGFRCAAPGCRQSKTKGVIHLVWHCPDAAKYWECLLAGWGYNSSRQAGRNSNNNDGEIVNSIFQLRMKCLPTWLVQWGAKTQIEPWDVIGEVANAMWAIGCAVIVTGIWRWNVDRVHQEEGPRRTLSDAVSSVKRAVLEAYRRYRLSFFPLTPVTKPKIEVADFILQRWSGDMIRERHGVGDAIERVGFFDGGSRGNPGPGGSGSVIVALEPMTRAARPLWAAATALGRPTTTNNIAEFIGLQRLLGVAVEKKWTRIHIVGDSQMILKLMQERREPKAKKLKYWYREARRLADVCEVASWTHHFRRYNKMADWLANFAMDTRRSTRMVVETETDLHELHVGISRHIEGDTQQWVEQQAAV